MEVWMAIKQLLVAGERLHLEIRSEKRSDPESVDVGAWANCHGK